jgi:hypothetical protein
MMHYEVGFIGTAQPQHDVHLNTPCPYSTVVSMVAVNGKFMEGMFFSQKNIADYGLNSELSILFFIDGNELVEKWSR